MVWDQGECNTDLKGTTLPQLEMSTTMGVLIRSWRKEWGQGDFAFICVQKPSGPGCAWDYHDAVTKCAQSFAPLPATVPPTGTGQYIWPGGKDPEWNQDYLNVRLHPNTAIAISSDLGGGLHPPNKWGYGARCARVALRMVYGRKISDKVQQPVAVRYAWAAEYPWANLFNKDGLPALPFRTDDWK